MKSIGGFLPLELPAPTGGFHPQAAALASGRACWHAVLQQERPRRVLVPFFICDAVLQPLDAIGVDYQFYPLTTRWTPDLAQGPADGELLLAVNYFGLLSKAMLELTAAYPGRVVVDDTQAFFRTGAASSWSFNSARKFFGVPDGGYLYGPYRRESEYPPSASGDSAHLVSRLAGDDDAAFLQYREHESRIGIEVRGMSPVSARLLASVDAGVVSRARRDNFRCLHERLGPRNQTAIDAAVLSADVPMCYPFLADRCIDRPSLWRRGLFIPQFWPELAGRPGDGFASERAIADRLLPLPIDQRYDGSDMAALCTRLLDLLAL